MISGQSHDYWDEAPYMSKEAADWLTSLHPDVIGFDFPQDYDIRKLRFGVDERQCYLTTHRHCLKYDIMMIEYMHNLKAVKDKFVDFCRPSDCTGTCQWSTDSLCCNCRKARQIKPSRFGFGRKEWKLMISEFPLFLFLENVCSETI